MKEFLDAFKEQDYTQIFANLNTEENQIFSEILGEERCIYLCLLPSYFAQIFFLSKI
jgi:hypothetical protein